ncbi:MAG: hypothetical protein ABI868_06870 [Acidobacteriota bacterium]
MGKVVLVKCASGRLEPVTAIGYDGVSETVTINRPVSIDGGQEVMMVPLSRCFEFDADMMEHVNTLILAAADKLDAVEQLCACGLLPAEFVTEGDPGRLKMH